MKTIHHIKKIKHHAHACVYKVGKHVGKHHKKYITGGLTYLLAHFFVVKVFLAKMFLVKIILVILALFGTYSRYSTHAEIQTICINNMGLVPFSTCKLNFTNIKNAMRYLEDKLDITNDTIYGSTDYHILEKTLQHYCPKDDIKKADKHIIQTTKKIWISFPKNEYQKLLILQKSFDEYKQDIIENDPDICKQKYIKYSMMHKIRKEFTSILRKKGLLDITPETAFDMAKKKNDGITAPALDNMIHTIPKYNLVTINDIQHYYKESTYSEEIRGKITTLANIQINNTIQNLIGKNVLTTYDVEELDNKINVEYVLGCDKTKGYYTIQQSVNGRGEIVGKTVQDITLKVNICFTYQYIQNLKKYIEQITLHELGHYVYYFKDTNPQLFEKECRDNIKTICTKNEFVSNYAQSGPKEDYAESFMHWYLNDIDAFSSKFRYFENLFLK